MRVPDLDLDLLRGFVTVAERGGFTAAGIALGLTQSAISLKVKRLEDIIGRRVLDRGGRGVTLTREGETLLAYARRMLALNDEAVRRMESDIDSLRKIEAEALNHLETSLPRDSVPGLFALPSHELDIASLEDIAELAAELAR